MPRLTKLNPKYRHHHQSGQAMVTLNGKDFCLGRFGTEESKNKYNRLVGEWLANGRRPLVAAADDFTIAELADQYLQHAKVYYRNPDGQPTGEYDPIKAAIRPLVRLYADTSAGQFGPLALEAVRNEMIAQDMARTTINMQTARIKAMFGWGVAKELVKPSVFAALRALAGLRMGKTDARETEPVRPVGDDMVDMTLPHLSSVVRAMVQLQRCTGARSGEICSMRIGEIDRSKPTWIYTPSSHKTQHHGHHRTIYLGPKAQEIVRPFLMKLDPTAYVFCPADAMAEMRQKRHEARKTPLSYGNTIGSHLKRNPKRTPGKRYNVCSYRVAIIRACQSAFPAPAEIAGDAANVKAWEKSHYWFPHQLRHTAATEIRKRFGVEAAQHVLGHSTLSVTEIYAEKNQEVARDVAASMG